MEKENAFLAEKPIRKLLMREAEAKFVWDSFYARVGPDYSSQEFFDALVKAMVAFDDSDIQYIRSWS